MQTSAVAGTAAACCMHALGHLYRLHVYGRTVITSHENLCNCGCATVAAAAAEAATAISNLISISCTILSLANIIVSRRELKCRQ